MTENYTVHLSPFRYKTSPLFDRYGVRHMFTTRSGGVSKGEFASMNLAAGAGDVRDSVQNVMENHAAVSSVFGLALEDICRTYQTHSSNVIRVGREERGTGTVRPPFAEGTDGLVTNEKGILLSIRAADCAPILIADPEAGIIGAVHSGWRGTLAGAPAECVEAVVKLGGVRERMIAAVGACIKKCCYEVGGELFTAFNGKDPGFADSFTVSGSSFHFDLASAVCRVLVSAGIKENNISVCADCTCCDSDYFSHRRQGPVRGTGGAFITL